MTYEQLARTFSVECSGIEVTPGVYSGCDTKGGTLKDCPTCHGVGKVYPLLVKCPKCKGAGIEWVTARDDEGRRIPLLRTNKWGKEVLDYTGAFKLPLAMEQAVCTPEEEDEPGCCGTGLVPLDPDRGFVVLLEALREQGYGVSFGFALHTPLVGLHGNGKASRYSTADTWRDAFFAAVGEMQKQEARDAP